MKNKYDRMSKEDKKKVRDTFKKEKHSLYIKFVRMYVAIIVGISYSIGVFIYDCFIKKNTFNYILDLVVFVFCIMALIKVILMYKDRLNDTALKNKKSK